MSSLVLDTHVVLWSIFDEPFLSARAAEAIDETLRRGEAPLVSAISIVEVTYLVEKGRIPPEAQQLLHGAIEAHQIAIASLDEETANAVRLIERSIVPDMPDRIIAATALCRGIPLVTCDERIRRALPDTVW
ncbi:MAG TPA: type II toxin-antitoxin system VapC family toxin [Polyangia bacterium]|nr:type II toxin-antitoxin system VapC family toxin [Polyangia bacterium]